MIHEFGLAKELGLYLKKDGEYRKGVIALPTQMAQSALNIMNHSVEQTVRFSDNEIIKFRNLIDPYIEGIPEGQALWEVALGEREDAVGKWLTDFLAEKEPQKKAELYADAQEYFKRANQTRKKRMGRYPSRIGRGQHECYVQWFCCRNQAFGCFRYCEPVCSC